MKNFIFFTTLSVLIFISKTSLANNCDITKFRWECDLILHQQISNHSSTHLIHCGNTRVYITNVQQQLLNRFLNANINMILKIDNQYGDSPCF